MATLCHNNLALLLLVLLALVGAAHAQGAPMIACSALLLGCPAGTAYPPEARAHVRALVAMCSFVSQASLGHQQRAGVSSGQLVHV
jgi:hypothetical protein